MSRQNPGGCIVVVLMTRWHLRDIGGRIIDAMANDDSFLRFETMTFPARNPPAYDYLFPKLYPPDWYESQSATLGPTMASALLLGMAIVVLLRNGFRLLPPCLSVILFAYTFSLILRTLNSQGSRAPRGRVN